MASIKLKISMILVLGAIISISTLAFAFLLDILAVGDLLTLAVLSVGFNLLQWLLAPYLINVLYRVKEADPTIHSDLIYTVKRLAAKAGIPTPKLMIADISVPNAFAYGSPLTGNMVAVTRGLLETLNEDEVEGVLGHELGHLKHRDVQVMMFASVLPSIFYLIGRSALYFGAYGRDERESRGGALALGIFALIIYFILNLFVLYLSRLREYYADEFSVSLAPSPAEGAKRLAKALLKISNKAVRLKERGEYESPPGFKALLIADTDAVKTNGRISLTDQIFELFSTHPNIIKRIKHLEEIGGTKIL